MEFTEDTTTSEKTTATNEVEVDLNADDNSKFKRQDYWDARFQTEDTYDWLLTYKQVRDSLRPHLSETDRILLVGCGNSTFSADLYDDGFHHLVNIDFSTVVIEKMRALHAEARPHMQWETMDMCALSFAAGSFDVVLDKAAMDALLVDEGDCWDPQVQVVRDVHRMCVSMAGVLRPGGLCLQISFAQPHFRTKYLSGERYQLLEDRAKEGVEEEEEVEGAGRVARPYSASEGRSVCAAHDWLLSHYTLEVTGGGCLDTFLYVMRMVVAEDQEGMNS